MMLVAFSGIIFEIVLFLIASKVAALAIAKPIPDIKTPIMKAYFISGMPCLITNKASTGVLKMNNDQVVTRVEIFPNRYLLKT